MNWQNANNILCIRLDSMGDVLMTTPAFRALRETFGAKLTLLTSSGGAAVSKLIPEIDDVIVYDPPWMKHTATRRSPQPEVEMVKTLRARGFDAAVIFTVYSQNPMPAAFLCYLAGIPLRLAHCRENPYQMLSPHVPEPEPERFIRHEVQRHLDLVASVGARAGDERLSLRVSKAAVARVRAILAECGVDLTRPHVVMHPGATAPSRRYAPEKFAVTARQLVYDEAMQVIFTGVEHERELVDGIRLAMHAPPAAKIVSLVGRLNLEEMGALLSLSPLLICNNTGPVHIAAAVGTPVVDLYALTNIQHTPWQVPHRVLNHDVPCRLCYKSICPEGHHRCLELVLPGQVVDAARDLLRETKLKGTADERG